jgi:hypothetical protein
MKLLQRNFTTPEQSKRLLELGVPADSADCYYLREHDDKVYLFQNQKESDNCISKIRLRIGLGHAMPCWSVGRLIEIMKICAKPKEQAIMSEELLYCRDLVCMLVFILEGNRSVIDFSKLEE